MSFPIECALQTGQVVYAVIHSPDGEVWNNTTKAFEAFNAGHWTNYAIALTEQGVSGYYKATYPAELTGVLTTEVLYIAADGVTPATTDGPPIGIGQSQGANLFLLAGDAQSADNLRVSAGSMLRGSVISGTLSTTQMSTNLSSSLNNAFNGRVIIFTSGTLTDQAANITGYNGLTKVLTFTGVTGAPAPADTFIIV